MAERKPRDAHSDEYELDIRHLWEVLRKRRLYVVGTFTVVLLLTALITFLSTPMYRASADLMVRRSDASLQALGLPADLAQMVGGTRTGDLTAHMELLKSQRVLERLVARLAGDPDYVAAAGISGNPSVPIDSLKESISVRQVTGADIIRVEATAESAREAALVANHLAEAYEEFDRDRARRSLQTVQAFLDEQIAETKASLELSEAELTEFAREIGMALEERAIAAKISRMEELHAEASVELEDTRSQLEQVNRFLDGVRADLMEEFAGPEGVPLLLEVMDKLTLIRNIQREIAQWEREREEALAQGEYIRAQNLQDKIIDKRKELEATAAEQFTMLEQLPQYEKLIQEQLTLTLKVEALENRVRFLESQIEREVDRLLEHGVALARLQRELDVSEELYTLLLTQYARVSVAEIAELGTVEVINPAQAPSSPFRPSKRMNLIVGAFLGLMGGVGAAFLREALDSTFRSAQELEETLGIPVLGSIPKIHTTSRRWPFEQVRELLLTHFEPGSAEYEVFMNLTANLRFLSKDKPLRSVVITAAGPGVGKSMLAANLALAWASQGKRVALVDGDLRRPVLERTLGVETDDHKHPGLVELIQGKVLLQEVVHEIENERTPLHFIPAGTKPANVVDLFSSNAFGETLERLLDHYDIVVLDSPPVNVAADATVIGSNTTGAILVVDSEHTTKGEMEAACKALSRAQVAIIGSVLNKVPRRRGGYYGAYGYHYSSYYHNEEKQNRRGKGNGPTSAAR